VKQRPVLFEVFTASQDESDALEIILNLDIHIGGVSKKIAKKMLGDKGIQAVKKILKK